MSERREGRTPIYRCRGKECNYSTDNLGAYIQHVINEKLPKAPPPQAPRQGLHAHINVKEIMDCPNCYPKAESFMRAKGYRRTLCPTCGVKLSTDILGDNLYCPKCGKYYRP